MEGFIEIKVFSLFHLWIWIAGVQGDMREYCTEDHFKASCDPGHVIIVTQAMYGRMRIGRCVSENFGYIGCSHDVLPILDRRCSGRRECSFRVLHELFPGIPSCHEDLKSFLEVDYKCQKVITAPRHLCQANAPVSAAVSSGFVSSLIADETKCGSADAPWVIQVDQGQKVNITLLDFSTTEENETKDSGALIQNQMDGFARVCRVYATIRETSISRSVTVCGSDKRERSVYVSLQNTVEIRIISSKTTHKNVHFLLKYEPIGCVDVETPEDGWVKRNSQMAVFGCKHSEESWQWICQHNVWLGQARNCSMPGAARNASQSDVLGIMSLPMGMSIVIIIALAFIVGILVLAIGLVFLRRQRPGLQRPDNTYPDTALMLTDTSHTTNEIYVKHAITCNITTAEANALMAAHRRANAGDQAIANDYASMKLLAPAHSAPLDGGYDEDHSTNQGRGLDPMVELKNAENKAISAATADENGENLPPPPLDYFDLDPEVVHYDVDNGKVVGINCSQPMDTPCSGVDSDNQCCPELIRGHHQLCHPISVRYAIPAHHQCHQCGGHVPPGAPKQMHMPVPDPTSAVSSPHPNNVQTLGRYRNKSGDLELEENSSSNKSKKRISFTGTLPR